MSTSKIVPVILSGGSGTRLWPLSRSLYPKQLLPLVSDKTMLQETALRVRDRTRFTAPIIVCNDEHRFIIEEQLHQVGIEDATIVIEPEGVARDGSFVIAWANDEYIFRQLVKHPEGWMLKPLNPLYPNVPIDSIEESVKGVVIMKKKPGRRRAMKEYV